MFVKPSPSAANRAVTPHIEEPPVTLILKLALKSWTQEPPAASVGAGVRTSPCIGDFNDSERLTAAKDLQTTPAHIAKIEAAIVEEAAQSGKNHFDYGLSSEAVRVYKAKALEFRGMGPGYEHWIATEFRYSGQNLDVARDHKNYILYLGPRADTAASRAEYQKRFVQE